MYVQLDADSLVEVECPKLFDAEENRKYIESHSKI
jgi:hypothetical protein